ncbi:MAG: serine/threonine protein kinase [Myxococcaceae bacterium]|nr:serine/threonine protein kinase [Myxococcaceae bacterium]
MKVDEVRIAGSDGTTVVVYEKRLSTRERDEPEAVARLRGEAALLAALGGRVTPALVGDGEDERGLWLRTAKVPFPTLAQRLDEAARRGTSALDGAWVERAVRAAYAALAELHEAADDRGSLQIVHADLSPANVAVDDAAARAMLIDLDLATWRGSAARDGAFRGTVAYAAPELARGEPPTPASDLFAMAATFLHAITGAAPRSGPSLAALLASAAEVPLVDAIGNAVELAGRGPAHAALIRCLAHLPHERPASAREVLHLLA